MNKGDGRLQGGGARLGCLIFSFRGGSISHDDKMQSVIKEWVAEMQCLKVDGNIWREGCWIDHSLTTRNYEVNGKSWRHESD